jgi:DNA (cytosine-5)-methyltransferase 1
MEPVAFADVSRANKRQNGPGFTDSGVAFTLTVGDNPGVLEIPDVASTMRGNGDAHSGYALADGLIAHTLRRGGEGGTTDLCMTPQLAVRRLTPRECERLQGFPDDHTRIPWRGKPADECPDGPRYKALGNSMATNCMQFIGRRIEAVEE